MCVTRCCRVTEKKAIWCPFRFDCNFGELLRITVVLHLNKNVSMGDNSKKEKKAVLNGPRVQSWNCFKLLSPARNNFGKHFFWDQTQKKNVKLDVSRYK